MAAPSIRFFDGRGANRPWLCEVPDPITKVAWQTVVSAHPETLKEKGLNQGDMILIQSKWGKLEAPVYESEGVRSGILVMAMGQGHDAFGRYAKGAGLNPAILLSPETEPLTGGPLFTADIAALQRTGRSVKLAHTDGSRIQHGRKIALSVELKDLSKAITPKSGGLGMWEFPLTLPLPEAYDKKRDF